MRRQGFKKIYGRVCGFMDGAGKVLEDVPDPVSEVKVKQMEIMDLGDRMDVMPF
jgi:hypothetical protein